MLARHAPSPDCAVLVGDRAGVVEWANASWTRITGFPLEATVAKPITHFLDEAELELALVDFVGQRFVEGRTSTMEFPFETFDGRSIWVHLDVHPVRNAMGEIAEFVAIAHDATERRAGELARTCPVDGPAASSADVADGPAASSADAADGPAASSADAPADASAPGRVHVRPAHVPPPHALEPREPESTHRERIPGPTAPTYSSSPRCTPPTVPISIAAGAWPWIDWIEQIWRQKRKPSDPRIHFDLALDPGVPRLPASTPRLLLAEATNALLEAACAGLDETWGCVTVMSGCTEAGRSHISAAHPTPARLPALARASWVYLEVHDTGPPIDPERISAARAGAAGIDLRAQRVALAAEIVESIGGVFHLDCTPGCGNQALALLHRGGA